ncbi:hypothetical protein DIPPA_33463 [Diplonema papillatum]|nr:hypothetical protein DIPPA_33463 [Diplonema papillatum]
MSSPLEDCLTCGTAPGAEAAAVTTLFRALWLDGAATRAQLLLEAEGKLVAKVAARLVVIIAEHDERPGAEHPARCSEDAARAVQEGTASFRVDCVADAAAMCVFQLLANPERRTTQLTLESLLTAPPGGVDADVLFRNTAHRRGKRAAQAARTVAALLTSARRTLPAARRAARPLGLPDGGLARSLAAAPAAGRTALLRACARASNTLACAAFVKQPDVRTMAAILGARARRLDDARSEGRLPGDSKDATSVSDSSKDATSVSASHKDATSVTEGRKDATLVSDSHKDATSVSGKDATSLSDSHKDATSVSDSSKDATSVSASHKDATSVTEGRKDATSVSDSHKDATSVSGKDATSLSDSQKYATLLSDSHAVNTVDEVRQTGSASVENDLDAEDAHVAFRATVNWMQGALHPLYERTRPMVEEAVVDGLLAYCNAHAFGSTEGKAPLLRHECMDLLKELASRPQFLPKVAAGVDIAGLCRLAVRGTPDSPLPVSSSSPHDYDEAAENAPLVDKGQDSPKGGGATGDPLSPAKAGSGGFVLAQRMADSKCAAGDTSAAPGLAEDAWSLLALISAGGASAPCHLLLLPENGLLGAAAAALRSVTPATITPTTNTTAATTITPTTSTPAATKITPNTPNTITTNTTAATTITPNTSTDNPNTITTNTTAATTITPNTTTTAAAAITSAPTTATNPTAPPSPGALAVALHAVSTAANVALAGPAFACAVGGSAAFCGDFLAFFDGLPAASRLPPRPDGDGPGMELGLLVSGSRLAAALLPLFDEEPVAGRWLASVVGKLCQSIDALFVLYGTAPAAAACEPCGTPRAVRHGQAVAAAVDGHTTVVGLLLRGAALALDEEADAGRPGAAAAALNRLFWAAAAGGGPAGEEALPARNLGVCTRGQQLGCDGRRAEGGSSNAEDEPRVSDDGTGNAEDGTSTKGGTRNTEDGSKYAEDGSMHTEYCPINTKDRSRNAKTGSRSAADGSRNEEGGPERNVAAHGATEDAAADPATSMGRRLFVRLSALLATAWLRERTAAQEAALSMLSQHAGRITPAMARILFAKPDPDSEPIDEAWEMADSATGPDTLKLDEAPPPKNHRAHAVGRTTPEPRPVGDAGSAALETENLGAEGSPAAARIRAAPEGTVRGGDEERRVGGDRPVTSPEAKSPGSAPGGTKQCCSAGGSRRHGEVASGAQAAAGSPLVNPPGGAGGGLTPEAKAAVARRAGGEAAMRAHCANYLSFDGGGGPRLLLAACGRGLPLLDVADRFSSLAFFLPRVLDFSCVLASQRRGPSLVPSIARCISQLTHAADPYTLTFVYCCCGESTGFDVFGVLGLRELPPAAGAPAAPAFDGMGRAKKGAARAEPEQPSFSAFACPAALAALADLAAGLPTAARAVAEHAELPGLLGEAARLVAEEPGSEACVAAVRLLAALALFCPAVARLVLGHGALRPVVAQIAGGGIRPAWSGPLRSALASLAANAMVHQRRSGNDNDVASDHVLRLADAFEREARNFERYSKEFGAVFEAARESAGRRAASALAKQEQQAVFDRVKARTKPESPASPFTEAAQQKNDEGRKWRQIRQRVEGVVSDPDPNRCAFCAKRRPPDAEPFKKCRKCKMVSYCSATCRDLHWTSQTARRHATCCSKLDVLRQTTRRRVFIRYAELCILLACLAYAFLLIFWFN